jgi:hypothetical protein
LNISDFFQSELSSILKCHCFNSGQLPFAEEIKNTEIGHLFEHVLLEYLCKEKIKLGHSSAQYAGHTQWNWDINPLGFFQIRIKIDKEEKGLLDSALKNTMALLSKLPPPKADSHPLSAWRPTVSS